MGSAFPRAFVPLAAAGALGVTLPALAQVAAAGGHPASVPLRGTATVVRDDIRYTITDQRLGARQLVRECAGNVCTGTWFDGERLFAFGINGESYPASAQATRDQRTLAAIASLRFAEPDFAGTVEAAGPGSFAVRAAGGTLMQVSIDPRTSLPAAASGPAGSPSVSFGPPQRAGGAAMLSPLRFDRVERDNEPLVPPAGPRIRFDPPLALAAGPAGHALVVPCRLERLALRCLFDTGSTPSSITLTVAERLGREPEGQLTVRSFETYVTGTVDAGPLTIANANVAPLHFEVLPSTRDRGYDVVVGSDILSAMRLDVNASTHTLRLGPPSAAPRGTTIPLTFEGGLPYVALTVANQTQAALFDTGDDALVAIGYDWYRQHADFPVSRAGNVAGVVGTSDTLVGQALDARAGPLDLGATEITVVRSRHDGHVGIGLAARCAILGIDLHEARLDCVPH